MSDTVIRVENLSKRYRIGNRQGHFKYGSLRDSLANAAKASFRSLRSSSDSANQDPEYIWALKDISFEVKQGEVLGIIGRNGAGKTTLLKILSRITKPTDGHVRLRGRVGSLLEVGTGFHPELTGRENIYLNGAVLGMKRAEINSKFDEIVDFSEIEDFLDTPVKHYSSGMYMRLAFAVAAHLEPEILLVDEVLAVGDAAFQKKCLGKMGEVAREGRTVLFVSHNMPAVESLCSRAILIDQGKFIMYGSSTKVINNYYSNQTKQTNSSYGYSIRSDLLNIDHSIGIIITNVFVCSNSIDNLHKICTGDTLTIRIHYQTNQNFISPAFVVSIRSNLGSEIIRLSTMPISGFQIDELGKRGYIELVIENIPFTGGRYHIDIGFVREMMEWILRLPNVITLDITPKDVYGSGIGLDNSRGLITVRHKWSLSIDE